ncbi:hypothetical protein YWS52_01470 [Chitiniphilus shinanonensis]
MRHGKWNAAEAAFFVARPQMHTCGQCGHGGAEGDEPSCLPASMRVPGTIVRIRRQQIVITP